VKRLIRKLGDWYIRRLNRQEWENQKFTKLYERPLEYSFALECISDTVPIHVLDVGSGKSPWPALMRSCGCMVTAIDEVSGYWGSSGLRNRHYHIVEDDILNPVTRGPFDMVTCISVLEHIPDHALAVRRMFDLLRPGGHLVVTVPFSPEGYIRNVYELPEASYGKDFAYIAQVFSPGEVRDWIRDNKASIKRQDYFRIFSGELWTFGEREYPYERVTADELYQLTALLLRKNE